MIINYIATRKTTTMEHIQRHSVTVWTLLNQLVSLQEFFLKSDDNKGSLHESERCRVDSNKWFLSSCRPFFGRYAKARSLIINQILFMTGKMEQPDDASLNVLVKDVTKMYVHTTAAFNEIVPKGDSVNEFGAASPPVMTHVLVAMGHSDFCAVVQMHWKGSIACALGHL